jgi:hypothetical protein
MYVVISQPSRGTSMSVMVGEGQGRLGGVADDWRELRTHILTPSHTTTRGCRTPPLLRLHTVGQTATSSRVSVISPKGNGKCASPDATGPVGWRPQTRTTCGSPTGEACAASNPPAPNRASERSPIVRNALEYYRIHININKVSYLGIQWSSRGM